MSPSPMTCCAAVRFAVKIAGADATVDAVLMKSRRLSEVETLDFMFISQARVGVAAHRHLMDRESINENSKVGSEF